MSLMALGFLGADDWDFATWAAEVSQRTNRSLAGRRVVMPDDGEPAVERFRLQAAQWGMVPTPDDATCTDDLLKAGEAPLDPSAPVGGLFDSRHAENGTPREVMDESQNPETREFFSHFRS